MQVYMACNVAKERSVWLWQEN